MSMGNGSGDTPEATQLNVGQEIYAPMGDLIGKISQPASIRLMLALMTDAELDEALEKPYLFQERFGFMANHSVRQQILNLQVLHQFTDEDIRRLKRSNLLVIHRNQMKIVSHRSFIVMNQMTVGFVTLITVVMLLRLMGVGLTPAHELFALLATFSAWALLIWPSYVYAIRPWRILKDAGLV